MLALGSDTVLSAESDTALVIGLGAMLAFGSDMMLVVGPDMVLSGTVAAVASVNIVVVDQASGAVTAVDTKKVALVRERDHFTKC